jgi:hypothetical protein
MIGSAGNPGPNLASLFPGFNWNNGSEFSTNRDAFVYPLIDRIMGTNIATRIRPPWSTRIHSSRWIVRTISLTG